MSRQRVSGQQAYKNFQEAFRSAYRPKTLSLREAGLQKALDAQATSVPGLGHPEYANLKPGESKKANGVVSFIDIRGFTKLSLALSASDLLRLVQALTEASIKVIADGGGYIGEFTGDGVMAYFGDSEISDAEAVRAGVETTSLLFKTVHEIVNPELKSDGFDPIRIGAGVEFGEILWSRVGVGLASQLKPIGTCTFFAGKLSTREFALPWECRVGAEMAAWVPDEYLTRAKKYGPVVVNGKEFSRDIFLLDWRKASTDALMNSANFQKALALRAGALLASRAPKTGTRISDPPRPGSPGPRPLKDQPFFSDDDVVRI